MSVAADGDRAATLERRGQSAAIALGAVLVTDLIAIEQAHLEQSDGSTTSRTRTPLPAVDEAT